MRAALPALWLDLKESLKGPEPNLYERIGTRFALRGSADDIELPLREPGYEPSLFD
jgi:hypothetical protein